MAELALLVQPSANRVYAGRAPALLAAELRAVARLALGRRLADVEVTELGGAPYVTCSAAVDDDVLAVVWNLSAVYAVFERAGDALRPQEPRRVDRWSDDLLTIQRYPGRTNEQFTRLALDLALAAQGGVAPFAGERRRVLDPLCGRGTTLNVAVHLGHHAAGIERERRDVEAYLHFFTTWLQNKRAKHTSRRTGSRTTVAFAADKAAQRSGAGQEVVVVADDTTRAVDHLGMSSVDVVVADLPYGVQHGSETAGAGRRRSPADLLVAALPAWRAVLRPGGAMALAWNTKVLGRDELVGLLEAGGFTVVAGGDLDDLAHRVDHAIERDVVVVRRDSPGGSAGSA